MELTEKAVAYLEQHIPELAEIAYPTGVLANAGIRQ